MIFENASNASESARQYVSSTVFLAWCVSHYCSFGNRPFLKEAKIDDAPTSLPLLRSMVVLISVVIVASAGLSNDTAVALALMFAALSAALTAIRLRSTSDDNIGNTLGRLGGEVEIGGLVLAFALSATAWALTLPTTVPPRAVAMLGVEECAKAFVILGAIVFVTRGGTHFVRGVLFKVDPRSVRHEVPACEEQTAPVNTSDELKRGRVIGALERIAITAIVAAGNYEALAFLAAAKGVIRSRKLKNSDFSEYFIIGTLASSVLALGVGIAIQQLVKRW